MLLDTHALIWWQLGIRHLSARARRELARARKVLISPVSCWELAVLVRKQRIALDREVLRWIGDVFAQERVDLAPLTATAAASAGLLGADFRGDFTDRLLYATARELGVPFLTKDEAIQSFAIAAGDVRTIW
ncbi:MAG: PIN domain-containing protein [Actinomycetota bacterium]